MAKTNIETILAFRSAGRTAIGHERIKLLEAVSQHGSITKAAQKIGISYKSAWDAIDTMNNLLPRPVIISQKGGARGGGAIITEDGRALIAAFHLLESRIARAAALLSDGDRPVDPMSILWSLGMKTSARNAFCCTVEEIHSGAVNGEVILRLNESVTLAAIVTSESIQDLGIKVGAEVSALIKSSFILLATGDQAPCVSARNIIPGIVSRCEVGAVNTQVTLDIGGGKSLFAMVTKASADQLQLAPGVKAWGLVKASHIILAVD